MNAEKYNAVQPEFISYEKCVRTWNEQWNNICCTLKKTDKAYKFEELVKDDAFCGVISQICEYADAITTYSSEIKRLFRGVNEDDETKICLERFIPQRKYVNPKSPNRMNGADKLYSYFAIEYGDCVADDLYYTSVHEIRLPLKGCFWGCEFKFVENKLLKFIDLRTKEKMPKDDERATRFLISKATHGKKYGDLDQSELTKWTIQLIFGVWENSNMFAPVDKNKDSLWLQYRPFHLICDYFERKGFDGIIYRSTVYKKGACLALFDVNNAVGIPETIAQIDGEKYR